MKSGAFLPGFSPERPTFVGMIASSWSTRHVSRPTICNAPQSRNVSKTRAAEPMMIEATISSDVAHDSWVFGEAGSFGPASTWIHATRKIAARPRIPAWMPDVRDSRRRARASVSAVAPGKSDRDSSVILQGSLGVDQAAPSPRGNSETYDPKPDPRRRTPRNGPPGPYRWLVPL